MAFERATRTALSLSLSVQSVFAYIPIIKQPHTQLIVAMMMWIKRKLYVRVTETYVLLIIPSSWIYLPRAFAQLNREWLLLYPNNRTICIFSSTISGHRCCCFCSLVVDCWYYFFSFHLFLSFVFPCLASFHSAHLSYFRFHENTLTNNNNNNSNNDRIQKEDTGRTIEKERERDTHTRASRTLSHILAVQRNLLACGHGWESSSSFSIIDL